MIESTFAVIFLVLLFLLYQVICLWRAYQKLWKALDATVDSITEVSKSNLEILKSIDETFDGLARQEKK